MRILAFVNTAVSSLIELLQPNKTGQVLPYLTGSTESLPSRFARVTTANGPTLFSSIREYMVIAQERHVISLLLTSSGWTSTR